MLAKVRAVLDDPELKAIVAAWPQIPPAMRAVIVSMAMAAKNPATM